MTFFLAGCAARAATHVMLVAIVIKVIRRIVQLGLGAISHRGWAGGAGCAWKGGVQVYCKAICRAHCRRNFKF